MRLSAHNTSALTHVKVFPSNSIALQWGDRFVFSFRLLARDSHDTHILYFQGAQIFSFIYLNICFNFIMLN
jgi:hypothetical protein